MGRRMNWVNHLSTFIFVIDFYLILCTHKVYCIFDIFFTHSAVVSSSLVYAVYQFHSTCDRLPLRNKFNLLQTTNNEQIIGNFFHWFDFN